MANNEEMMAGIVSGIAGNDVRTSWIKCNAHRGLWNGIDANMLLKVPTVLWTWISSGFEASLVDLVLPLISIETEPDCNTVKKEFLSLFTWLLVHSNLFTLIWTTCSNILNDTSDLWTLVGAWIHNAFVA